MYVKQLIYQSLTRDIVPYDTHHRNTLMHRSISMESMIMYFMKDTNILKDDSLQFYICCITIIPGKAGVIV